MRYGTDLYEEWLERREEREVAQWLRFADEYARRWLRRRNALSVEPLDEQDLEDILSEARIAVLRFKLPEQATQWEPCLTAYVQRVCQRAYARALRARRTCLSLETLPEPLHPLVEAPLETLDDGAFVSRVAQVLQTMPAHHAAAFVLSLEAALAEELAEHAGLDATLRALAPFAPLPDRAIAHALNLTPRAVIRARQHAREKLRKRLPNP